MPLNFMPFTLRTYKMDPKAKEVWLHALKNTPKEKRGRGKFYDSATGRYCAIGLLLKLDGHDFKNYEKTTEGIAAAWRRAGQLLGNHVSKIWAVNDSDFSSYGDFDAVIKCVEQDL